MTLTLKKDLVITDPYTASAIMAALPWGQTPYPTLKENGSCILHAGTTLPDGPLHPIAALAFAMAGFELEDNERFRYQWRSDEGPLYPSGWYWVHPTDGLSTNPKVAPEYARIVGHRNPEVL